MPQACLQAMFNHIQQPVVVESQEVFKELQTN